MTTMLADNEFRRIAVIARERWGLNLTDGKRELVSARLSKFLRTSAYRDARSYLDHLETGGCDEDLLALFDLLSTNVTSFFRERQHFDYLAKEFYPRMAGDTSRGRRLRIWSAACSTGQEPYSLAMHAMESLPEFNSWDLKILATDLSNSAVEAARSAVYPEKLVQTLPQDCVERCFLRGVGERSGFVRIVPELRRLVTVRQLNLMDRWPMQGPMDVIFCRNVMIYFDSATRSRLVQRMLDLLRPGGLLVVGSAETLGNLGLAVTAVQPSVYVK